MKLNNIKRYFCVVDNALFTINGKLGYDRVSDAIIALANAVHEYDGDNNDMWSIGEFGECSLDNLIVGAYWHYTEWHAGQWSKGYAALCALGQVFSPGMTGPEDDNSAYMLLNEMAAS